MSTDLKNPTASGMNYKVINQPSITMPDDAAGGNTGWRFGSLYIPDASGASLTITAPEGLHCLVNMAYSTGSPNSVRISKLVMDGVEFLLPPDSGGNTTMMYLNSNNTSSESQRSHPTHFCLIGIPFKTLTIELTGSGTAYIGWCDVEVQ